MEGVSPNEDRHFHCPLPRPLSLMVRLPSFSSCGCGYPGPVDAVDPVDPVDPRLILNITVLDGPWRLSGHPLPVIAIDISLIRHGSYRAWADRPDRFFPLSSQPAAYHTTLALVDRTPAPNPKESRSSSAEDVIRGCEAAVVWARDPYLASIDLLDA